MFRVGDPIVYRLTKHSTHPGKRAKSVSPSSQGELYSYFVDKFWIVADILSDEKLLVKTRRGKTRVLDANDPNLRTASVLDRIRYRRRFPNIDSAAASQ